MKIIAITNQQLKGHFPLNKTITNAAYSSLFSLALLSGINNLITSEKDCFVKETIQNNELQALNHPIVNKAQTIYSDGYGQKWVRYKDYDDKYKEYRDYRSDITFYKDCMKETEQEIKTTNQEMEEKLLFIQDFNQNFPSLVAQRKEMQENLENISQYYEDIQNSNGTGIFLGGFAGLVLALISRKIYKFAEKKLSKQ